MISYKIIVQNGRDQRTVDNRTVVTPSDDNYRDVVFQRNLNVCHLSAGDRVKLRKGHSRGTVKEVINNIKHISWQKNRPMFVVVAFDDGKILMCNPSQLKRSKV